MRKIKDNGRAYIKVLRYERLLGVSVYRWRETTPSRISRFIKGICEWALR